MKASKLPSGHYRVNLYLGRNSVTGKEYRKSITANGKRECMRKAMDYLETHKTVSDKTSVSSAMHEYCEAKENVLSVTTIKSYYGIIRDYEFHYDSFCKKDIYNLSSTDIQEVVDDLKHGRNETTKTISNKIGFLSAVCTFKKAIIPDYVMPQKEKAIYNIPEKKEVAKMLKCASDEGNTELYICILLAATCTLRRGEIAGLDIKDVDFKKRIIHIRKVKAINKDNEWIEKSPKTYGSDRYILISQKLAALIKKQGYVTHWTPREIYENYKKLLKEHNIGDYNLHSLRHFSVSEMKAAGIPDNYICSRTGHSTSDTMSRVYTHVLNDHKDKIDKGIVKHFDDIFKNC